MRPADAHLTPQEIDDLLFGADVSSDNAGGGAAPEAQQHLSGCAVCQAVAERYRKADAKLRAMGASNPGSSRRQARGPACPPEDIWVSLAGGLIADEEAKRYLTHASTCDWCGPLLKESMEDLAQDVTPDEQEALVRLPVSSAAWQREMANKLVAEFVDASTATKEASEKDASVKDTSVKEASAKEMGSANEMTGLDGGEKPGFLWWSKLAWSGAGMAVMAVAVWVGLLIRGPDVDQLLAKAYTRYRTIELRIPNAGYGPIRVTRGPGGASFSKPQSLLEAKSIIKHKLDSDPDNPRWLAAEGRAELLDGEYGAAVQSFKRALEKNPESADLMRDAATAYFERGERESSDSDYRNAAELFSKSLAVNRDDPIALYNRAIVYERMFLFHDALADWEHYLTVDRSGEWSQDAERRRQELQNKLKQHQQSLGQPLLGPDVLIQDVNPDDQNTWSVVDARVEDYLDLAITEWLPRAFPVSPSTLNAGGAADSEVVRALQVLARILEKRHGDKWLADFLATSSSPSTASALQQFRKALRARSEGKPAEAEESALKAGMLFQVAGNLPGMVRSQLERVYALQRAQQGDRCLTASKDLAGRLAGHDFGWISAQLLMEEASCQGKMGDLGRSERLSNQALASAQQGHFTQLQLRALAIAADIELSKGRSEHAWAYDRQGLAHYWQCICPPLRGYAFYDNLEYIAEGSGQWHFALAVAQEAVAAIAATSNSSGEAMARFRLASTEKMLGRNEEAVVEFARAQQLFAAQSQRGSNRLYMLYSQLSLAELQVRRGEVDAPLGLLLQLEPELQHTSNYLIPLQLNRALAAAYLQKRQYPQAEEAALRAVQVSERGLRSIHSHSERLVWRSETSPAYRVFLESYLQGRHDPQGALEFWEWYRAAPLREVEAQRPAFSGAWTNWKPESLQSSQRGSTFRELQARLSRAGLTFLAYAQVPDGLIIWSFDDSHMDSRWVPISIENLATHVRQFVSLCGDPNSDVEKLKAEGRFLYGILIAPIEQQITGKNTLVIELDGAISRLPVQALVDASGRYLGELHAISISLGLAFLKADGETGLSGNETALVVNPLASAGNDLDLPPLPDAAQEADEVAAQFSHAIRLSGPQATLTAMRRAFANATVFHFAGHALIFGRHSGLLLARENGDASSAPPIWDAEQIRQSDLRNVKLVVLSSCTTEDADSRMEDDPDSVVGTFLLAGVSHVVASRWNVDSKFTQGYMQIFYSGVLLNTSIAEAKRIASSRSHEPRYDHPYFWASFVTYGYGG
jgi:CHAT domain-containing protein/tetratricopeptide (TPR) repeat protein